MNTVFVFTTRFLNQNEPDDLFWSGRIDAIEPQELKAFEEDVFAIFRGPVKLFRLKGNGGAAPPVFAFPALEGYQDGFVKALFLDVARALEQSGELGEVRQIIFILHAAELLVEEYIAMVEGQELVEELNEALQSRFPAWKAKLLPASKSGIRDEAVAVSFVGYKHENKHWVFDVLTNFRQETMGGEKIIAELAGHFEAYKKKDPTTSHNE